jgi:hypothetical protein
VNQGIEGDEQIEIEPVQLHGGWAIFDPISVD